MKELSHFPYPHLSVSSFLLTTGTLVYLQISELQHVFAMKSLDTLLGLRPSTRSVDPRVSLCHFVAPYATDTSMSSASARCLLLYDHFLLVCLVRSKHRCLPLQRLWTS
jgi:hypothetical protein